MGQDGDMPSPDFSLRGAVDLGARQAAAKRQQERQAAPGGTSPYVVDVTDDSFNTEAVQRSRTVPVLVTFGSARSAESSQLDAILEKLAVEAAGRWILARVDIDVNQQLTAYLQQMGIRDIPFVAAMVAGQLIPFLDRAAPEAQIRQGVDQLFAALKEEGLLPEGVEPAAEGEPQPEGDPAFAEAEDALRRGDLDAAAAAFTAILDKAPQDADAKSGLALVELSRRAGSYDAQQVLSDAEDRPGDAVAQTRAADIEMVSGRIEAAFERLVAAVRRTSGEDRDLVRTHLLGLLEVLPSDDPRVGKARRALQSALF